MNLCVCSYLCTVQMLLFPCLIIRDYTMTGVSQDGGEQILSSNELPNNLVVTVPTLSLLA